MMLFKKGIQVDFEQNEKVTGAVFENRGDDAKSPILVIHPTDPTTDVLKLVYEGLDVDLITSTRDVDLRDKFASADRVFCCGHGLTQGLIGTGMRICVDDSFAPLFKEKTDSILIWCNADTYVRQHRLSAFCTGMFVSEPLEAKIFNVEATEEQIDHSNELFSRLVNEAVKADMTNEEMAEHVLKNYNDPTSEVIKYNRVRLGSFRDGVLTRNWETVDSRR